MTVTRLLSLLNAGARAVLVLMALAGTANLAIAMAFTPSTLQARVDAAVRRAPVSLDDQADIATTNRLSPHQR